MPDVPSPVTSTPAHPWQPWDASESGAGDPQTEAESIYDGAGGGGANPWVKVRDGGHASPDGASVPGSWPPDGSSSPGPWKQT